MVVNSAPLTPGPQIDDVNNCPVTKPPKSTIESDPITVLEQQID